MLDNKRNVVVGSILAVTLLSPLAYYAVLSAVPQGTEPFLERPDEKYRDCVRDTTYMRFNHWVLLRDVRDQFVREGVRGEIGLEIGLNNCKECHTSRVRFCDQCHNAVNLTPDCFDCHYYPDYPEAAPVATGETQEKSTESSADPNDN